MTVLSAYPAAIMPVSSLNLAQKHSPWLAEPVTMLGVSAFAIVRSRGR